MITVLQLIDTLAAGGAERLAVNVANTLPREKFRVCFCTTRAGGVLEDQLSGDVMRLELKRKRRFDLSAIKRLRQFVREYDVRILHAHGTAVFMAVLACLGTKNRRIIWHDHAGGSMVNRAVWPYRLVAKRFCRVLAVSEPLARWARERLRFDSGKVLYLPNFVVPPDEDARISELVGTSGRRIICVANLLPPKDHLNLIEAMARVVRQVPEAKLFLVGSPGPCADRVQAATHDHGLEENAILLGQRRDVFPLLRACDIGVLSSRAEGLPLSLIEYGTMGLAAVSTRVGQCSEVLDDGNAGILVPPSDPIALADALIALLTDPAKRRLLGDRLRTHVTQHYGVRTAIERISSIYAEVTREAC